MALGEALLRQRARQAERKARVEAQLAKRIKSEFISNMSHELRTPLNTLLGFSKLLAEHDKRRLDDADIVQYAGLINDAGKHLLTVVNDILDISKMQSGNFSLNSNEVYVVDVLSSVIDRIRPLADEAKVALTTTYQSDDLVVRGDEQKIGQAVHNILSNAVKFTPEAGEISVSVSFDDGRGTVIEIRDSGVGMTAEEIAVALEPFGQVDGSHTRWREGTGLGLPIAKALVELHNGEFRLASTKGEGTTVSMLFPLPEKIDLSEVREIVRGGRSSVPGIEYWKG